MKRNGVVVIVLGLLVATTGCLMPRAESLPLHTYQLNPFSESPLPDARTIGDKGPVLLISLPQSDPGFDTQRIAYRTRPYELNYFSTSQWADTPARMLSPLLVAAFEQAPLWGAVVTAPTVLRADYRIDVSSLVLVQEFLEVPSHVRISWRVQLVHLLDGRPLGARRFEAVQVAPSEDAYGGAQAANQALAKLLGDVTSWVAGCVTQPERAAC